ncbi:hypothetical protein A2382_01150 [Candidatus Woesebacteria bacterium RIFOXYB1_FULL_38_16]|uniref:Glycosyltransferase 2-like domain-containing protein n=1 Tax=Candidatus Woesebacteria bacterium RIFOXYB1_FULL_38_16 TaxID=1802538 RepID=A0A1F8CT57_9BACT|nr:MAG: hypothetical protein A2191_00700 [Candidatus Woesebacteria bacterium RIFOXYA1_FULL_38_9]OGM79462.1 MAG: hypothetical protein A2382_01150 [Candidatus Woesebacteria bacterium RIFOXYB1_FULL_38_16]
MVNITGVVLSQNEEKQIKKCLESITWCDEVIVIDDYSNDNTQKIAEGLGARVFKRKLGGDFSGQRNFALRQARHDWVLFVDADEIVSDELKREIIKVYAKTRLDGFYIKRIMVFNGKVLCGGEWSNQWILRLARRESGKWIRAVHEFWEIENTGKLGSVIYHEVNDALSLWIQKIGSYAKVHAQENRAQAKKANLRKLVLFPILKFFHNFIFLRGFRDGTTGFVLSVMMSLHSFLAWSSLYSKLKTK